MNRISWRVRVQGGYARVFKYVDGVQHRGPISVNSQSFGNQVAAALNEAYAAGVADGEQSGRKAGRDKVADMLDSRFDRDGYGEWQDGWRSAAREARQYPA